MGLTTRDGRVLLLRTNGDQGQSYGGFRWPLTVGAEIVAPDWDPTPRCGGGLHGLPWACGDWSLLEGSRWMVFSALPADVVDIDGNKSKVRAARVEHIGTRESCIAFIATATPPKLARGAIDTELLSVSGDGYGSGYGYGYRDGSGYGSGSGYGYRDGSGDGYGYRDGSGYGYGSGDDIVVEVAA